MYGVVLMVAMAGGAETPAGLFHKGGCCGTTTYSCCGTSYSGCCGGGHKHKHKHKGCCGSYSCCGSSCCGAPVYSCCGAPAVGCYGSPAVGCSGAPAYGAPAYGTPGMMVPEQKIMPETKPETIKKKPMPVGAAPARITVTVPGDAVVSIDGTATTSTEATRTFESPVLAEGKAYTYTFKAEFVRDGKNVVVTRNVEVKAGSDITVSLENESVVASR